MADITIYLGNKNYSSWSLRPWLALKQTGVTFDEVVIPLRQADSSAEIRRVSPSGRVPALRHGGTLVWDSLAICEYLAEIFPEAGLWPADRAARAAARSVSAEMHAGFPDLRRNLPMDLSRCQPHRNRAAAALDDIDRVTAIWRDCRERFGSHGAAATKNGNGDFLFGGFSIADAMFAPVASRFRTYGVALDPTSAAYVDAVWNWPAMREWAAAAEAEPWTVTFDVFENSL
jgi:glutathione S-transferase